MGKLSQLLGIGILGFIIISCGNYSKSKNNLESQSALDSGSGSEADSGSGAGSGNEAASLVDFKAINASFLEVRCVGCHGAYKVYANVIRDLNKIQASIETNRMPKFGGALSTDQKLLLAEWIANGAPEIINSSVSNPTQPQPNNPAPPTTPDNPNNPTPPVAPDDPVTPTNPIPPTEPEVIVTFEAIKSKIFEAKCTFCHGGSGFPRFLNFSTLETTLSIKDRVFAGNKKFIDSENPKESYLLEIVGPTGRMPPQGFEKLSEEDLQLLEKWIQQGTR